ncbi:MAG: indolepyruvate ferredoxin oxidoreductase subunit alpha [Spirochaetaceae bacterium]|nr:indolepyruvate ferredoxin oxidoreductase subunit alpha [Spirochaetaceae bacterium]
MDTETLLGDEAIALGALHAGIAAAYAYPGTPSTEIMEYLQARLGAQGGAASRMTTVAQWCANEKTAYESALGTSFAGGRALVSMKHVGLNVAADPFVNSALIRINGGLVVVVADDPGMHSSQDEQDSRAMAAFARVPCFEPADQQEAYDMVREAFDYSESHEVPVLFRITTRLAHARAAVRTRAATPRPQARAAAADGSWILMPANARKRWRELLGKQAAFQADAEAVATLSSGSRTGVVTCGIAGAYYGEFEAELRSLPGGAPTRLHIGRYPIPAAKNRALAESVDRIVVLEEGYPIVEEAIRGIFGSPVPVAGKMSGELPLDGELTPDLVRRALGLSARAGFPPSALVPPSRPPQFCQGCPHSDSYNALNEAMAGMENKVVASDIGCYTLGALPPYNAIQTCVDMGASVGMARGAAEAGVEHAVAVIGDSTFYHSGLSSLLDAVSHGTNMTLMILDNDTTGMTGAQPTIVPGTRIRPILEGLGVDPTHIRILRAHRNQHAENVAAIREELAHRGVSVVVMVRECIEALKKARCS